MSQLETILITVHLCGAFAMIVWDLSQANQYEYPYRFYNHFPRDKYDWLDWLCLLLCCVFSWLTIPIIWLYAILYDYFEDKYYNYKRNKNGKDN